MAYRILVSAPVPFWVYLGWNWVGLGWDWVWGDWGLRGWGLGLDKNFFALKHFLEPIYQIENINSLTSEGEGGATDDREN